MSEMCTKISSPPVVGEMKPWPLLLQNDFTFPSSMGFLMARSEVEAVLVRRVIIGDGSCRCDGLDGIPVIGGLVGVVVVVVGAAGDMPTTDDGLLSSVVIWMLLDIVSRFLGELPPSLRTDTSECENSKLRTRTLIPGFIFTKHCS